MALRTARAIWNGSLREGSGIMSFGGGAFEGAYSFPSRFDTASGNSPEELLGAAHAGCFSMALSGVLQDAGYTPHRIDTTAQVHLNPVTGGFAITKIILTTKADIPKIDAATFEKLAEDAKKNCPVSKALAGVAEITLKATLV
jgi:osmotically inducible protein OsmC